MSYQVLARKWRPKTFQEMVGQEHILRMLNNALSQKRLHHAYLFTGTRGVGKTTLGRILAKCFNCESGITPTPCGICATCKAIDDGQYLDLFEVDAASRTKVEDTRELLENVLYPPTQGRYKIYLIDEVHMLSNHSFNALLKTLEEPPSHIKFLLATTDPKKLPVTILSRCLQFHLKRILPEQITQHLQHICECENIQYAVPALAKLAKAADGSMRDALSLLDQAIAYGNNAVNEDDVMSMLGSIAQDDLWPLLKALSAKDGKQLFKEIHQLAERVPDFSQLLEELISIFHKIAITQVVPETVESEEPIASLAKCFAPEDVQLFYQIALLGRRDLSLAAIPQQGFEMTLIRMLAFKPALNSQEDLEKIELLPEPVLEKTIDHPIFESSQPQPALAEAVAMQNLERDAQNLERDAQNVVRDAQAVNEKDQATEETEKAQEWRQLLPKLELSGMAYALASNCSLAKWSGNQMELELASCHQPMLNQKLKNRIVEALTRYLKKPIQLEIKMTSTDISTPIKQQQDERKKRLAETTQAIKQNPQIKNLIEMYDATVEVSILDGSDRS